VLRKYEKDDAYRYYILKTVKQGKYLGETCTYHWTIGDTPPIDVYLLTDTRIFHFHQEIGQRFTLEWKIRYDKISDITMSDDGLSVTMMATRSGFFKALTRKDVTHIDFHFRSVDQAQEVMNELKTHWSTYFSQSASIMGSTQAPAIDAPPGATGFSSAVSGVSGISVPEHQPALSKKPSTTTMPASSLSASVPFMSPKALDSALRKAKKSPSKEKSAKAEKSPSEKSIKKEKSPSEKSVGHR